MSIITQQIKNEKEYKSILTNILSQITSERPRPMSVTGLSEGASEAFYTELISDTLLCRGTDAGVCVADHGRRLAASGAYPGKLL